MVLQCLSTNNENVVAVVVGKEGESVDRFLDSSSIDQRATKGPVQSTVLGISSFVNRASRYYFP